MFKCKSKLFCIFLIVFKLSSFAQEKLNLSLSEAINIAKKNSLQASMNLNLFYASQVNFKSAMTNNLPLLNGFINAPGLNRSYIRITQPDGTVSFREQVLSNTDANLSLQQNITPLGGVLSFSSSLNRIELFEQNNNTDWLASPFFVSYRQPILRFNELKFQWQMAKLRLNLNTKAFAERTEDLSINITQVYFDAVNAEAELKLAEFNLSANDTLLRIANGRYNIGKIGEDDLLQTELRLMNAQNSFDQAKLNYFSSMNQLRIMLGISKKAEITLNPETNLPNFEPDIEKAIRNAKSCRSDFVQITIDQKQIEANLRRARLNKLPNAELTAVYGLNRSAQSFSEAYRSPVDQQQLNLGLSLPIMNWGKFRNDFKEAKYQFRAKEAELQLAYLNLEQEVVFLVMQYNQLKKRVLISAKADTIAQKRYQVAKNRFFIGKTDNTNLNIAQTEKDMARNDYYRTLRDYWISYYRLRRTTLFDFENQKSLYNEN